MSDEPRFGEKEEEKEAVAITLERQVWWPATTMPENPHEYAKVFEWVGPVGFHRVVQFIKDYGYWGRWKGHRYKQYDAGEHFYWVMWPPHILILSLIHI